MICGFKDLETHPSRGVGIFLILAMTASVVWWLACWPLVPEFAGSILTEAVAFFPM
jgi:hypothetical protein